MNPSNEITIHHQIEQWYSSIKSEPDFTDADAEELKTHLLDMMEELQDSGLDEEEAFIIAKRRLGSVDEFKAEYRQENQEVLQTRRSAIILSGVLIYFFSFHLVGSLAKLLFITLLKFDVSGPQALSWLKRSLEFAHLIFILFFVSILLSEKRVIVFIENLKIRPKHSIIFLITTLIFGIANVSLMAIAKSVIGDDAGLRGWFLHYFIYFEYTFPFLFCIGFILIYSKYYRKAKI
jgi:hypothetical protein